MADDTDQEREEPMDDDPFAVFHEWASEADQRAYADLEHTGRMPLQDHSQADGAP